MTIWMHQGSLRHKADGGIKPVINVTAKTDDDIKPRH